MAPPAATAFSWICPACRRSVPLKLAECRCGMPRAAAGAEPHAEESSSRPRWSPGEMVAGLVLVVAAVFAYRGMSSEPAARIPVAPPMARREPPRPVAGKPMDPRLGNPSAPPSGARTPAPGPTVPPLAGQGWGFDVKLPEYSGPPTSGSPRNPPSVSPGDGGGPEGLPGSSPPPPEPAPPAPSEVDLARKRGEEKLSATLARLAQVGRRLAGVAQRYESACPGYEYQGVGGDCDQMLEQLAELAVVVADGIEEAEDAARTSWVQPGRVREMRRSYGLDDSVWEEISRIARQYRR